MQLDNQDNIKDILNIKHEELQEDLMNKIMSRMAVIGIVGLGYVGLPLAIEKAKAGYKTIGFDIQKKKVDMINNGVNYIGDIFNKDLVEITTSGLLSATNDWNFIKDVDCVAICVPTPLDEHKQPDLSYIKESVKNISKGLHEGMLIVLESTTYPGTTDELVKPLLEKSGLRCEKDFFLAFSPERVDPGNLIYKTQNTPKVVGGVGKRSTQLAVALYQNVLSGEIFEVSSSKVAEMEKLLENTYRNVNIALANEMCIICSKMGIDVWDVIEAAKTKPYGFQAFYPGPGVGGHCIPLDPYYLTWKAKEYDYHSRLIEAAGEINSYMPQYVVERAMKILNKYKKALNGSKILILGVAYKPDIRDFRESPALKIIKELIEQGAIVSYSDPYIPDFKWKGIDLNSVELTADEIKNADMIIISTKHSCYDYEFIQYNAKLIFDTQNAMEHIKIRDNIERI
ncbi:nucleotide sugar dehydrogenase [Anaerovorax odorimutans]|uniref:nucleotide sugar dehydrogenase n=1 Tax=Anaerovorax odorimutans TaxID=109327 RepID=UPI000426EFD7|nr:nucleotide sugar dehydrogenase [Anaerovorax odorimutans]